MWNAKTKERFGLHHPRGEGHYVRTAEGATRNQSAEGQPEAGQRELALR
jgi:hypothetical protein